jgi:DNA-binding XRE family transcriptional regulator
MPPLRVISVPQQARKFRKLRAVSGLKQVEAAHNAGISNSSLCLFERGFIALKPKQLARLDAVLKRAIKRNAEYLRTTNQQ